MKRFFDIIVSFVLILLFSPLFLTIALSIRLFIGKPVLFKQIRPGIGGNPFKLIKFRTMSNIFDSNNKILADEDRMTRFGKFLRGISLDELPELFNVLKGDMSLVGPRPLLLEYLELYTALQARRHEMRPGITGWAQINGRNLISWEERFSLDIWYIENHSFFLDLKILFLTFIKVLKKEGINEEGNCTMSKFKGSHRNDT